MNWTLIVVLVILIGLTIIGMCRGLVKMAFSAISILAIVILTSVLAPQASKFLANNTGLMDTVRDKTEEFLYDKEIINNNEISLDSDKLLLPNSLKKQIEESASEYLSQGHEAYNAFIIDKLSKMIFTAAVYVGMFIVLCIAMVVLYCVLNVVSKLPVLNQVNRLAGGIIGAVTGFLLVWLLMMVFTSIGNTTLSATVSADIENSGFLSFLYNKNLLIYLLVKVF